MIDLVRNAAAAFAKLCVAVAFMRVIHGVMLAIFGQGRSWVFLTNYTEISRAGARSYDRSTASRAGARSYNGWAVSRAGARSYNILLLRGGFLGVAVCAQAVLV